MNAQTVTIEFGCCGASYTQPIRLGQSSLLLHAPHTLDLPEHLAEVQHASEHPECADPPTVPPN